MLYWLEGHSALLEQYKALKKEYFYTFFVLLQMHASSQQARLFSPSVFPVKNHLSKELFFQLVGPLLVGLGVHS